MKTPVTAFDAFEHTRKTLCASIRARINELVQESFNGYAVVKDRGWPLRHTSINCVIVAVSHDTYHLQNAVYPEATPRPTPHSLHGIRDSVDDLMRVLEVLKHAEPGVAPVVVVPEPVKFPPPQLPPKLSDEDRLRKVFRDRFWNLPETKNPLDLDATFEELGLDSLDQVELTMAVEDEFAVTVSEEVIQNIRSPRGILEALKARKP